MATTQTSKTDKKPKMFASAKPKRQRRQIHPNVIARRVRGDETIAAAEAENEQARLEFIGERLEKLQKRELDSGKFAPTVDRMCVCGHPLSEHASERATDGDGDPMQPCHTECGCYVFTAAKPTKSKRGRKSKTQTKQTTLPIETSKTESESKTMATSNKWIEDAKEAARRSVENAEYRKAYEAEFKALASAQLEKLEDQVRAFKAALGETETETETESDGASAPAKRGRKASAKPRKTRAASDGDKRKQPAAEPTAAQTKAILGAIGKKPTAIKDVAAKLDIPFGTARAAAKALKSSGKIESAGGKGGAATYRLL